MRLAGVCKYDGSITRDLRARSVVFVKAPVGALTKERRQQVDDPTKR